MTRAGDKKRADIVAEIARGGRIPEQTPVSWRVAVRVSWGSLKRRLSRSLITMTGVILAIAFLTYMLINEDITSALVHADLDALNILLQKAGVDIFAGTGPDRRMLLLIALSLVTCLVGIVNSMLMSVTERVREIGTMKCLGAMDSFILKSYFIEASLQGILGTFIGLLLGFLVAFLVGLRAYGRYVLNYFPVGDVFFSLVVSIAVGSIIAVLAAIAPAQWAARKEPVDAMRVEE